MSVLWCYLLVLSFTVERICFVIQNCDAGQSKIHELFLSHQEAKLACVEGACFFQGRRKKFRGQRCLLLTKRISTRFRFFSDFFRFGSQQSLASVFLHSSEFKSNFNRQLQLQLYLIKNIDYNRLACKIAIANLGGSVKRQIR